MKKFNRVCIIVMLCMIAVIAAANCFILFGQKEGSGRPYRVEISRLVRQMKEVAEDAVENLTEGPGQNQPDIAEALVGLVDLSECAYVTAIVPDTGGGASFFEGNSDYVIREIGGVRYRFEYTVKAKAITTGMFWTVNVVLIVMSFLVLFVLWYVRQKVLLPFTKMENVPYELSRGNLTMPLTENKTRFFGRFIWGVNLLRENIEQQKERELSLQKEKKTLLLSLSHDIKTPLSAIKLYAKALSKGLYAEPEKQKGIAESIDRKADEIEGFVAEIVRASSEDFLSFELHMGEFYLSELLEEIRVYYEEKLALIKTDFIIEKYVDCLLTGDKERAIEVIQNLMENAIKYGNGERICISVTEEEHCALVSVINGGCTLPESELSHVFDSFWRGSNTENKKGSGLGLYICRQLMRKMGGEVYAEIQGERMRVTAVFPEV
ncbi:MAG: HAMP domain-containing histidine kinase [Lachnospiraceae bacterium]|nr:HAMP domain-containing histidine kinase [Lachnospiraceae bacterium]